MSSQNIFLLLFGLFMGFSIYKLIQRKKVQAMLKDLDLKSTLIIDVRSPGEFATGSFPGSINIPLDQFQSKAKDLDISQKILVCCASGARSSMAKRLLHNLGAKDVLNVGAWHALIP